MFNEYITLGESILISIFCMVVVFIALYLISYIVDVTRIFTLKKEKKSLGLDASSIGIIGSPDGPTAVFVSDKNKTDEEVEDDTELVAVIAAAIAAMTETDVNKLAIKSIKRLANSDTEWSRVGRIELMR